MRIAGIVTVILNEITGEDRDPHRLEKLRNEQSRNHYVAGADAAVSEAEQSGGSLGKLFGKLNGTFLAVSGKSPDVAGVVIKETKGERATVGIKQSRNNVAWSHALLQCR